MRQILDLHIHSKYSRSCSPELNLENIDKTCRTKGVDIVATGDFTFPQWFSEIKNKLTEIFPGAGLYKLKTAKDDKIKFILSTEVALIYKDPGMNPGQAATHARRIHLLIHAPNIAAAEKLNNYLDKHFNIRSDGRPILGLSAPDLMKLCLNIDEKFLIYPAHIWTPWYAVFGSKSGFDKIEDCFHEYAKNIYALETGLSSDPEMNWRLSALDRLTILSNSDAHSLPNIGREANVFKMSEITYGEIYDIIKNKKVLDSRLRGNDKSVIESTIEFYPEEGMYHYDGHREHGIRFTPEETKKHHGLCPVCKKPLTIGVMNRVDQLADRPAFAEATAGKPVNLNPPVGQAKFVKLVELDKIIAEALDIKSRHSAKVQAIYNDMVKKAGNELKILLDMKVADLEKISDPIIVEGIKRVREGKLIIEPGFDGQYGTVKIFKEKEKLKNKQNRLF